MSGRTRFCHHAPLTARIIHFVVLALIVLNLSSGPELASAAQATLSWIPPATNADGSPLTDLGGFKIYYGTASRTYTQVINVGTAATVTIQNLLDGPTYYFAVTAFDKTGNESAYSNEVKKNTVTPAAAAGSLMIRAADRWYVDLNNNGTWDGPSADGMYTYGLATDIPVSGDFNGDGMIEIGIFRNGLWALDMNGNGLWDGAGIDKIAYFGMAGDIPLAGDWNGDGRDEIGVFRRGLWALDFDGSFTWDGPFVDPVFLFGLPSDKPVAGDWNGDGLCKVGVFRDGIWYLDMNADHRWDGCTVDKCGAFGTSADIPVTGDWNGNGFSKLGVYRDGVWYLDINGNARWDNVPVDEIVSGFTPQ